jgi:hypothetical protein
MIFAGRYMQAGQAKAAAAFLLAAVSLAGCGESGLAGALRSSGIGGTPDEFLVLPTKPLEMPTDLAALPRPTPGARNRVDPQPEVEAVTALTGRPAAAGVASAPGLVAVAGPIDPQIRARLAAEDAVYRRENQGRLLERLANRSADASIYENMRIDANTEFLRLRAQGVRVPAAPPIEQ